MADSDQDLDFYGFNWASPSEATMYMPASAALAEGYTVVFNDGRRLLNDAELVGELFEPEHLTIFEPAD